MDSLTQSGAHISARRKRNRENHDACAKLDANRRADGLVGGLDEVRANAITNEIEPFMISLSSTAVAGEYDREGEVETRE